MLPGRRVLHLSWGNRTGWGPWDWTPRALNVEVLTEEGSWVSFHISFWFVLPPSSPAVKIGGETVLNVYTSVSVLKKAFQDAKQYCWWQSSVGGSMQRRKVCVETTVSKRGIDMQMAACARCCCLARWLLTPPTLLLLNPPRATAHPNFPSGTTPPCLNRLQLY